MSCFLRKFKSFNVEQTYLRDSILHKDKVICEGARNFQS